MEQVTYKLGEFIVAGVKSSARPIEWDREIIDGEGNDAFGVPAIPIKYECSCPNCGNCVSFSASLLCVKCPECGAGNDVFSEQYESPFCDPGEFVEVDTDFMSDSEEEDAGEDQADVPDVELKDDDVAEISEDAEITEVADDEVEVIEEDTVVDAADEEDAPKDNGGDDKEDEDDIDWDQILG